MIDVAVPRREEFLQVLQSRVPRITAQHCISATEFMLSFGRELGLEEKSMVAAGLLHDLCKAMPHDELIEAAELSGITVTPVQRAHPDLLHGPVSAIECRFALGITDNKVFDAIYWHTTGSPCWCRLGQALYFADFAEPQRPYHDAAEARAILEKDGFDAALLFVAERKLAHIQGRRTVDPMTEGFVEWLRSRNL